ncbi:MAG: hypothetical protein WCJ51_00900 [Candidatus Moraniibacteriota bacterium]
MFFHIRVFLNSLIFLVALEFVSADIISAGWAELSDKKFLASLLLFMILLGVFFQLSRRVTKYWRMTLIPMFFVASSFGLLYFIQPHWEQHFFIVVCAVVYYLLHLALYRLQSCRKDKTANGFINASNMATIFLVYAVAYGVYLNFAIPLWFLMVFVMGVTTLVSLQNFSLFSENKDAVLNYSLILGFIMAQLAWVFNFWPFGYLTTSVIGLAFYFVFWDITRCYFLERLSKRRIVANMIFLGLIMAMVLSSTRWLPVV